MKRNTEILSPAGDFDSLRAAISGGCNAVYLAGKMYGARSYAKNFTPDELIEAVKLCHLYNVKVYVTCNTICYEKEIEEVCKYIDFLYENDVDAVIVQDIGLASIIKHRYPNMDMHASTQINAQTLEDVKVLKRLGFSRVILGREVTIDEIKRISENVDIELEVFIHGALCISYSGNCYFSLLEGGRSGNRGKCAQPCRKIHTFNGKEKYFLSPKDLCTIDYVKEISKYVDSLKIEGRMKSKEYVYYVTKAYHDALTKNNFDKEKAIQPVRISFNRGFTKGFIENDTNANITNVFSSNHLGEEIGEIVDVNSKYKDPLIQGIKLKQDLYYQDSLRIVGEKLDVVVVNQMYVKGSLVKKTKANEIVYLPLHKKMSVSDKVYITKREEVFELPKILISGKGYLENDSFVFEVNDDLGNTLIRKLKYEITEKDFEKRIYEQLNKTGNTSFIFSKIDLNCKNVYLNIKELNELRREILDSLAKLREKKNFKRKIITTPCILDALEFNDNFKKFSVCFEENKSSDGLDYDVYLRNYHCEKNCYYYLPRVSLNNYNNSNVVSSSLGVLGRISSVYTNVVNSYSVRVLESLGFQKIGLSIELSYLDANDLISAYRKRYNRTPVLEVMIYGYIQMMYMKHCFINKEFKMKEMHCNLCKKGYLLDDKYPVYGDQNCHLSILSDTCLNQIDKLKDYEKIGIKHFLIDLINNPIEFTSIDNLISILEKRNK